MNKIKLTEKNKRWIGIVVLALFLVMNVIIILNHEHWRDEGNTWQMAKVLNPVELLRAVDGEGHPFLFYFYLMSFAKPGFPYTYAAFLCLLPVAVAVWLLFFHTEVPFWLKILLPLSSVFTGFVGIDVRNYCLLMLFGVLAIVFYKKRTRHPFLWSCLIFAIFETHFMYFGFAAALCLQQLLDFIGYLRNKGERSKGKILEFTGGLSLDVFAILILYLQLHGPRTAGISLLDRITQNEAPLNQLWQSFWEFLRATFAFLPYGWVLFGAGFTLVLIIWLLLYLILKRAWQELMILLIGSLFMVFFHAFIYEGFHIHHGCIFLFLYVVVYGFTKQTLGNTPDNEALEKPIEKVMKIIGTMLAGCVLTLSIIHSFATCRYEIDHKLSNAPELAQVVAEKCAGGIVMVGEDNDIMPNAAALIDDLSHGTVNVWDIRWNRPYTWIDRTVGRDMPDLDLNLFVYCSNSPYPCYYLSSVPLEDKYLEEMYRADGENLWTENFYLYRVLQDKLKSEFT